MQVRLGGIYALERIVADSRYDRLTIEEVLCAFIRLRAPLSPGTDKRNRPSGSEAKREAAQTASGDAPLRVRASDVQAAVTVLGRRPAPPQAQILTLPRISLTHADLPHANLSDADLHYSDLSGALATRADFRRADLTGVWLAHSRLTHASLYQADLRDVVFWDARLEGADLRGTDLTGADLTGACLTSARLDNADLRGADFTEADLADASLRNAIADASTIWPAHFQAQSAGLRQDTDAPAIRPQHGSR